MVIEAISKKNQKFVNKAYKFYRKYQELNNLFDKAETEKEGKAIVVKAEKAYGIYDDALSELPHSEVVNFDRKHKQIHGY